MHKKKSVKDVEVKGRKIFMRVDFNVPLKDGLVRDDTRIRAVLPTIEYLVQGGARIALGSHLGRPAGKPRPDLTLDPVAARLSELLGRPVIKLDRVTGSVVIEAVNEMRDGDIVLLENLRFEEGEEKNDPVFARTLAEPFDLYVGDAFGAAHRAHASTAGVAGYLPAVAGLLMQREIEELSRCLDSPERPLVVILGGAKVSDKINVVRRFLGLADTLLVGGGMANTFLAARGYDMGSSFFEREQLDQASALLGESENSSCRLLLPVDLAATKTLETGGDCVNLLPGEVKGEWKAVDIGPETAALFSREAASAKTVIWNGPLGVFEIPPFDRGTAAVAGAVVESGAYSLAGGGDLVAALESLDLAERFSFISTGGGATLEFWEGRELPGITVLEDF